MPVPGRNGTELMRSAPIIMSFISAERGIRRSVENITNSGTLLHPALLRAVGTSELF